MKLQKQNYYMPRRRRRSTRSGEHTSGTEGAVDVASAVDVAGAATGSSIAAPVSTEEVGRLGVVTFEAEPLSPAHDDGAALHLDSQYGSKDLEPLNEESEEDAVTRLRMLLPPVSTATTAELAAALLLAARELRLCFEKSADRQGRCRREDLEVFLLSLTDGKAVVPVAERRLAVRAFLGDICNRAKSKHLLWDDLEAALVALSSAKRVSQTHGTAAQFVRTVLKKAALSLAVARRPAREVHFRHHQLQAGLVPRVVEGEPEASRTELRGVALRWPSGDQLAPVGEHAALTMPEVFEYLRTLPSVPEGTVESLAQSEAAVGFRQLQSIAKCYGGDLADVGRLRRQIHQARRDALSSSTQADPSADPSGSPAPADAPVHADAPAAAAAAAATTPLVHHRRSTTLLSEVDASLATARSEGNAGTLEQTTDGRLRRLEAAIAVKRHDLGSSAHEPPGLASDAFEHGHEARPLALSLTADGYLIRAKGADPRLLLRDKGDGQPRQRSHGEFDGMGHGCLVPRVWDVLHQSPSVDTNPAASDESSAAALQLLGVTEVQ